MLLDPALVLRESKLVEDQEAIDRGLQLISEEIRLCTNENEELDDQIASLTCKIRFLDLQNDRYKSLFLKNEKSINRIDHLIKCAQQRSREPIETRPFSGTKQELGDTNYNSNTTFFNDGKKPHLRRKTSWEEPRQQYEPSLYSDSLQRKLAKKLTEHTAMLKEHQSMLKLKTYLQKKRDMPKL